MKRPRQLRGVVGRELAGHAEVDEADLVRLCSRTRMFAGCGSAWKKPWRKIIVIQRLGDHGRRAGGAPSIVYSVEVEVARAAMPSSRSSVSTRALE